MGGRRTRMCCATKRSSSRRSSTLQKKRERISGDRALCAARAPKWDDISQKGLDEGKDQSYFLCMLSQSQIERAMFPIGEPQKADVAAYCRRGRAFGSEKKDLYGYLLHRGTEIQAVFADLPSCQSGRYENAGREGRRQARRTDVLYCRTAAGGLTSAVPRWNG